MSAQVPALAQTYISHHITRIRPQTWIESAHAHWVLSLAWRIVVLGFDVIASIYCSAGMDLEPLLDLLSTHGTL